ncbi:MAG: hypothetical protein E7F15_08230 [Clostridiales bacterium]|nr:hypothetical protein [Clostridiales bacterium]
MIRKQNATFQTAFVSEAQKNLKNSDCFAYVELDGYACYVLADGIDDLYGEKAARLCVDTVISAFTERPSMSRGAMKRYLRLANQALVDAKRRKRMKASVMIVIHDYTKLRYAQAGNVRFRLYRDGFLQRESKDQSLSMDWVTEEKIPQDALQKHEERHNLYTYIGQRGDFAPVISKKYKLTNTDCVALYTRGFWENVDEGEVLDLFKDAGTDPQEVVNTAEDLLLSKQPEQLAAYSFAAIFVEKTFIDPNQWRRIKRILLAAIPIVTVLAVMSFMLWLRYDKRRQKTAQMNDSFLQTVEYILADNYIKAETTIHKTLELAGELKDKEMKEQAKNYLLLVESTIEGDEKLAAKQYSDAQTYYLNALDRSRFADMMGEDYLQDKLQLSADYMAVYDSIVLGDSLAENLQYDKAEQKYLEAKALATKIYFEEGRQNALRALEELYALQKDLAEEATKQSGEKMEKETSAANFLVQGDKAFTSEDYAAAQVFYNSAKQKYEELEDAENAELVEQKIANAKKKQEETEKKRADAENYVSLAEQGKVNGDVVTAKKYYLLAKDIYARLKEDDKVKQMETQIEILDLEKKDDNTSNREGGE